MIKNKPWSVQVELVEGCTRLCWFCGINSIRKKPNENIKCMDLKIADKVSKQASVLCSEARYEFAMHGEPLLHKEYLKIFKKFRERLPKAQMQVTTNGMLLIGKAEQKIKEIFKSGIDYIVIDTYREYSKNIRQEINKIKDVKIIDYYLNSDISIWANHRRKIKNTIFLLEDLGDSNGKLKSRKILNHAGNAIFVENKEKLPLSKTCTNPFREISVCYNGDINICCMDWKHEYICGNISNNTMSEIWYGRRFEAVRTFLQNKNRRFKPCHKCNKDSGVRAGLLQKYPPISKEDFKEIL